MEEHLWTSSFWRLLSTCPDSRKLLILQKIILHKLGNKPEFAESLTQIINANQQSPKDKSDKQTESPVQMNDLNPSNECPLSHLNVENKARTPVMGTNALLAKYKNCAKSKESAIIANLVNSRFNKTYDDAEMCQEETNLDPLIPDLVMSDALIFDEEQFLEDALGDEIKSFVSADYDDLDLEQPQSISITSSRISSLISRVSNVYESLKRRVSRTSSPYPEVKPCIQPTNVNTEADLLLQEASIQHQIIIESCKALNVCLSSKEFLFRTEHIEAERILLLAMYKQNNILKEMKLLQYNKDKSQTSRGFANISRLKFPLTARIQKEGYTNWFVAIVNCGRTVWATNAVANSSNVVEFEKRFQFENLEPDFEITVNVYSLLAKSCSSRKDATDEETATCLTSPDKLLCRRNSIKLNKNHILERREPSFKLWGKTSLTVSDVEKPPSYELQQIPNGAILQGTVYMNFNTRVDFDKNVSDFLTVRTECDNYMAWNLRWCNLIGHVLYYWNYPADQDSIQPLGQINLQQCVTTEICVVDRNLCARPRTLLVETAESSEQGTLFLRHFLSADSTEKMVFWKNHLNEVLTELIKWNMMKCKVHLI